MYDENALNICIENLYLVESVKWAMYKKISVTFGVFRPNYRKFCLVRGIKNNENLNIFADFSTFHILLIPEFNFFFSMHHVMMPIFHSGLFFTSVQNRKCWQTVFFFFFQNFSHIVTIFSSFSYNNQPIEIVESFKYLGVIFDNKSNFSVNYKSIKNKCITKPPQYQMQYPKNTINSSYLIHLMNLQDRLKEDHLFSYPFHLTILYYLVIYYKWYITSVSISSFVSSLFHLCFIFCFIFVSSLFHLLGVNLQDLEEYILYNLPKSSFFQTLLLLG
ncbi:hypothetical protein GQR58_003688 [Nymphon striatum]|nr:hypothetical protein GQR58_003688 [Nymphon striatum]